MLGTKNVIRNLLILIIVILFIVASFFVSPTITALATDNDSFVYLGGIPIGVEVNSKGLVVSAFNDILLTDKKVNPAKEAGILEGDLITHVNESTIKSPEDFAKLVNQSSELKLRIIRNTENYFYTISPVFDPVSGQMKIGLVVKNTICGIGTLTFIKSDGSFCTLGHHISDPNLLNYHHYQSGKLFSAKVLGVLKATKEEPGALKGAFDRSSNPIGEISQNNLYGVYGINCTKSLLNSRPKVEVASRDEIKAGRAYVYTTINGAEPEKYQIEIVKTENQSSRAIKSMVIRVTDKRLLDQCGGIVQGMSGSPIVQNGKLVGAVTHVLLNDPTIGYGIYADWML